MAEKYEKPRITTLPADQIVESMGPVSCGSGAGNPGAAGGLMDPSGSGSSGNRTPNW
jgi:hypothetical protein